MGALSFDIRNRLQALAGTGSITGGGYTLLAARAVLGMDALALNNTFRATLVTDGPYLSIRRAKLMEFTSGQPASARYLVPCDLWIGIARETDNTFVNEETFVEAIKTAWAPQFNMEWDYDPLDVSANPAVLHYLINVTAIGC